MSGCYLVDQQREKGELLGEVIAASFSGRSTKQWRAAEGALVDSLRRHPQVAFFGVNKHDGNQLYSAIFDSDAWTQFLDSQRQVPKHQRSNIKESSTRDLSADLVVRTVPVWPPSAQLSNDKTNLKPQGAVFIGLNNPAMRKTITSVYVAQGFAIIIVCLASLPIARLMSRRWSRPLRELLEATQQLAADKPPKEVSLKTNDELGYLSVAFNEMARKLQSSRRLLIEANDSLEQKVHDRSRELSEAVKKLDELASTDPLTGLANRRAFGDKLQYYFERSIRCDTELACIMIDLDGFKPVNDALGHETGDKLMSIVAHVLKENTRSEDISARLGGDEFVVLMPQSDEATAEKVGQRILTEFESETAKMLGHSQPVTKCQHECRIGISQTPHAGKQQSFHQSGRQSPLRRQG